jgi:hypothetical protein
MKKAIFALVLVSVLSSCGGGSNEASTIDSTKVDSVKVDSTVVIDSSTNVK